MYTHTGASASKKPINAQEDWVSRIDLDLVPPPLSVSSLIQSISANEGITASPQLFTDKNTMIPISDNNSVLTEDGAWPGSTAEDHVLFKFDPFLLKFDGSKYCIQNFSTGRTVKMQTISDHNIHDIHLWHDKTTFIYCQVK